MKRFLLLPLMLLATGCLSPLTRRLDAVHQEMIFANEQLILANEQLAESNRRLTSFDQQMRKLLGPANNQELEGTILKPARIP